MVSVSLPRGLVSRPARWMSFAPHGAKLLEWPQGCTFFRGIPFLIIAVHLHFPVMSVVPASVRDLLTQT